jgi:hypothetical protein
VPVGCSPQAKRMTGRPGPTGASGLTQSDIHLLLLERRDLSVEESILSRADMYQSRIIEPNVAISANRMAETISPVTIALLFILGFFD